MLAKLAGSVTVTALLLAAVACGDSDGDSRFGDGSSGGQGSGGSAAQSAGGSSAAGGTINIGSGGNGGAGNASGSGGGTGPSEDTCDGIDNDNDGVIDDVDVGQDGICDCLRIATLGEPGRWGQGDIFSAWLDARSDNGAVHLHDAVLEAAELDKHQVIVVQDVSVLSRSYAQSEIDALRAWVEAGGGLMTLIGYDDPDEIPNVNSLLAPLGLSYGSQPILQKQGGSTIPVTGWVAHPTTQGVSRIGVDNGYPVQGGPQTVASEGGFDVAKAVEVGAGHVFVWGDEWITYDSEWSGHPEYQVELFWLNVIKWLTPVDQCQVAIPPDVR
jgi:hypothetical protein